MKPLLPLSVVDAFVPMAAKRGVSEVARSGRGFVQAYQRGNLSPEWLQKREGFISRHMAQIIMRSEPLWTGDVPSRRHLALIMWAYSPEPGRLW